VIGITFILSPGNYNHRQSQKNKFSALLPALTKKANSR
jgi:hypothetical protein